MEYEYNVDTEKIFLPSKVVTQWFNESTNEKHATVKVSKMLKQKFHEGGFSCIQDCASRANGRGFLWVGQSWDCVSPVQLDLEHRIEISGDKRFSGF